MAAIYANLCAGCVDAYRREFDIKEVHDERCATERVKCHACGHRRWCSRYEVRSKKASPAGRGHVATAKGGSALYAGLPEAALGDGQRKGKL